MHGRTIGERIKAMRLAKKMSMQELADEIGITDMYISYLERDMRDANVSMLIKLSKALNCTLDFLILGV